MKLKYISIGIFILLSFLLLSRLNAAEAFEDALAGMSFSGSMGRGSIAQNEKTANASKTYLLTIELPDKRRILFKGGKWSAQLNPKSKPIQGGKVDYEITKGPENTLDFRLQLTSGLLNLVVLSVIKPGIKIKNGQIDPQFLENFKTGYLFAIRTAGVVAQWKTELSAQVAQRESPNVPTYKNMLEQLNSPSLGHFGYMHEPFFDKYFGGLIDYVYLQAVSTTTPLSPKGNPNIELKRSE